MEEQGSSEEEEKEQMNNKRKKTKNLKPREHIALMHLVIWWLRDSSRQERNRSKRLYVLTQLSIVKRRSRKAIDVLRISHSSDSSLNSAKLVSSYVE